MQAGFGFFSSFSELAFLFNSFLFSVFAAIIASVLGTLVLVNRMNYLSSGLSHSSLGGIGLGVFFGFSIPYMAAGFALLMGLWIAYAYNKNKTQLDSFIDMLYAFGMALGAILIQLSASPQNDYSSFLFGSLLLVNPYDLWAAFLITVSISLGLFFFYQTLLMVSFDREFAYSTGIKVEWVERGLILSLAFCLPFLVRTLGLTLTIALLSFSPLILEKYVKKVAWIMFWSCFLNLLVLFLGIFLAYFFDLSIGSVTSLLAVAIYSWFFFFSPAFRLKKS